MSGGAPVRIAVDVAIEGLPGPLHEWVMPSRRAALRAHVLLFVHDFARARGVILEDSDVLDDLDLVIAELKGYVRG